MTRNNFDFFIELIRAGFDLVKSRTVTRQVCSIHVSARRIRLRELELFFRAPITLAYNIC